MARGGARANSGGQRPGAGRPKGAPNKATALRAEAVKASGIDPLEVMIRDMRALYYEARHESDAEKRRALRAQAREAAKAAAPYVHQRLAAVHHTGEAATRTPEIGEVFDFDDYLNDPNDGPVGGGPSPRSGDDAGDARRSRPLSNSEKPRLH